MKLTEEIKNKFNQKVDIFEKSEQRIFVNVAKEDVKEVVRFLYQDLGARFSIASGIDTPIGVEMLYHMAFDRLGVIVSVRVLVEKPDLTIDSFTSFMPATEWIERELHEMLGVNFPGHPGLKRLLLPDDWPEGVYPFRKKTYESEKEVEER